MRFVCKIKGDKDTELLEDKLFIKRGKIKQNITLKN